MKHGGLKKGKDIRANQIDFKSGKGRALPPAAEGITARTVRVLPFSTWSITIIVW
jgi:hypothetical protein